MNGLRHAFDPVRWQALPWSTRVPTDRPSVLAAQLRHLQRLLFHAQQQVPLFRHRFAAAGVSPGDVRSLADFHRLPAFTRRDLQDVEQAHRIAEGLDPTRLLDRSTSGSTGERMTVHRTWFEERLLNLFRWRAWRSYGLRLTDRMAVLYFHRNVDPRDGQRIQRAAQALGLYRNRVFDALGDPRLAQAVAGFQPHAISGMTSAIAHWVDIAAGSRSTPRPRFIATGGELLTEPLRARIAALGVPVHDLYGCNELNLVAWECPSGNGHYHVCDDAHHVEVLDAEGREAAAGDWGEVVVTSLFSYAMPFIRYRLGDLARRGPDRCPCGAACSTLLAIGGRTIDRFPLADGRCLHPWEVINAVRPHFPWMRQYQLVQTSRDRLVFRVVPRTTPTSDMVEGLARSGQMAMGGRATFEVELTEAIHAMPSGKPRPFVALKPQRDETSEQPGAEQNRHRKLPNPQ